MRVLIDGYNLLHVAHGREETAGIGRQRFCRLLAQWSKSTGHDITVVFDGTRPPEPLAGQLHDPDVEVMYSGGGRTADDVIAERIRASSAPRRLLVVSSDRAVRRSARKRRCLQAGSPEFLELLLTPTLPPDPKRLEPGEKQTGPSEKEAEEWMRRFGYDGKEDLCDYPEL